MPVRLLEATSEEPVTLEEAKKHLRVDGADQDEDIERLIPVARAFIEGRTGRALCVQRFAFDICDFPTNGVIELPRSPFVSLDAAYYIGTDNSTQDLGSDIYVLMPWDVGTLVLASGKSWPETYDHPAPITLEFTAGYGTSDEANDALPPPLKHAILLMISHLFANREPVVIGDEPKELPMAIDALIAPYVVYYS